MKKKILSVIVCAAAILSLTACGNNEDPLAGLGNLSTPTSTATSKPASTKPAQSSSAPQQSSTPAQSSAPEESKPEETSVPSNVKKVDWSSVPVADELDFVTENVDGGVRIIKYVGTETIVNIPDTIDGKRVVIIGDSQRGDYPFADTNVTDIKVPDGVTEIMLLGCETLESIVLPNGLKKIGGAAFIHCRALKSIEIPNTVTEIDMWAFRDSGIESLTLPDSVKEIPGDIIMECADLKEVSFPQNITLFSYSGDGNKSFSLEGCSSLKNTDFLKNITVPEDKFFSLSFWKCSSLTSITFPEGVDHAGDFGGCESLTEITFPDTMKSYSGSKFNFGGCTNLKKITLPDSMEHITTTIKVDNDNENLKIVYKGKTYKANQVPTLENAIKGN